jgi:6-pyruvoyltetrahydropterin/6-carboxytetrahydropterin synthase
MFRLVVKDHFSGAHRLRKYHGSCERLHGHNWRVEAALIGAALGTDGLLIDFKEIKRLLHAILDKLDHTYLNSLPAFKHREPTAELIAQYLYGQFMTVLRKKKVRVDSITVYESDDSSAQYYG